MRSHRVHNVWANRLAERRGDVVQIAIDPDVTDDHRAPAVLAIGVREVDQNHSRVEGARRLLHWVAEGPGPVCGECTLS